MTARSKEGTSRLSVIISMAWICLTVPYFPTSQEGSALTVRSFASIPSGLLRRYLTGKRLDWISLSSLRESSEQANRSFRENFGSRWQSLDSRPFRRRDGALITSATSQVAVGSC